MLNWVYYLFQLCIALIIFICDGVYYEKLNYHVFESNMNNAANSGDKESKYNFFYDDF